MYQSRPYETLTTPPRAKRQIVMIITSVESALALRSFIIIPSSRTGPCNESYQRFLLGMMVCMEAGARG